MTPRPESLGEKIYADLLDGLQTGQFAPDHRFVDVDVAAHYGISRMPAREALLRLTAEGYLVGTTRGFAIRTLSLQEISELCEVRRQLEPRAAASAAGNLDARAEAALTKAMNRIRSALDDEDMRALLKANVAFRDAWLGAVANRRLADIIARFMDQFLTLRLDTFENADHRARYVAGLTALHEAFLCRDALAAGDAMTRFMFEAEAAYLAARTRQLQSEQTQTGGGTRKRAASRASRVPMNADKML